MEMLNNATSFNQHLAESQLRGQQNRLDELGRAYANPEGADQQKLKKAAQEFEGIFVKQLLDAMDKTIDRSEGLLSGGSAEEYFRGMLNDEVAKSIATRTGGSGFGLAEAIYRQMADAVKPTPLAPTESLKIGAPKQTHEQEG